MDQKEFQSELTNMVDEAINEGLSRNEVEGILQSTAQTIREEERSYDVYIFECPKSGCENSHEEPIDRVQLRCDLCGELLTPFGDEDVGDAKRLKFECGDDHGTIGVHDVLWEDITCSIHGETMELVRSGGEELGTEKS